MGFGPISALLTLREGERGEGGRERGHFGNASVLSVSVVLSVFVDGAMECQMRGQ